MTFEIIGTDIVWNRAVVQKYLQQYDEFMNHLLVLTYLGSGAPARGTELSAY